jgi:hypothetical protein
LVNAVVPENLSVANRSMTESGCAPVESHDRDVLQSNSDTDRSEHNVARVNYQIRRPFRGWFDDEIFSMPPTAAGPLVERAES